MFKRRRLAMLAAGLLIACNGSEQPDGGSAGQTGTGGSEDSGGAASSDGGTAMADDSGTTSDGSSGSGDSPADSTGGDESDSSSETGDVPVNCGDGIVDPEELCDDGNAVDGDGCDADCTAPSGAVLWEIHEPNVAGERRSGDGVALDTDGNIYVSGTVASAGTSRAYLRRYDAAGEMQWEVEYDEVPDVTRTIDVALGPDGQPTIAGGHWIEDPGIVAGFVATFSDEGVPQWSEAGHMSAGTHVDVWERVAVDTDGSIVLCGMAAATASDTVAWVRKLDAAGIWQWTWTGDSVSDREPGARVSGCGIGADGEIALGGAASPSTSELWTGRLDSGGTPIWTDADEPGDGQGGFFDALAVGPDGESYVAGFFQAGAGVFQTRLERRDADGSVAWSQSYPNDAAGDRTYDVAVHADGSLTLTGLVSGAGTDGFVRRVGPQGQPLWDEAVTAGDDLDERLRSVAVDAASGAIVAVGTADNADNASSGLWLRRFAP